MYLPMIPFCFLNLKNKKQKNVKQLFSTIFSTTIKNIDFVGECISRLNKE